MKLDRLEKEAYAAGSVLNVDETADDGQASLRLTLAREAVLFQYQQQKSLIFANSALWKSDNPPRFCSLRYRPHCPLREESIAPDGSMHMPEDFTRLVNLGNSGEFTMIE